MTQERDRDQVFAPANGVKSRRQLCVELVQSLEPGAQIPYSEVMDLCDCERQAAYAAMREAAFWLERHDQPSVITRARYGWEVIDRGASMLRKADHRTKKVVRAGSRAADTALAVDRGQLSQFERQEHDGLTQGLARAAEIRARKSRSLAEIARAASRLERPDPRVRQLPSQRGGEKGA